MKKNLVLFFIPTSVLLVFNLAAPGSTENSAVAGPSASPTPSIISLDDDDFATDSVSGAPSDQLSVGSRRSSRSRGRERMALVVSRGRRRRRGGRPVVFQQIINRYEGEPPEERAAKMLREAQKELREQIVVDKELSRVEQSFADVLTEARRVFGEMQREVEVARHSLASGSQDSGQGSISCMMDSLGDLQEECRKLEELKAKLTLELTARKEVERCLYQASMEGDVVTEEELSNFVEERMEAVELAHDAQYKLNEQRRVWDQRANWVRYSLGGLSAQRGNEQMQRAWDLERRETARRQEETEQVRIRDLQAAEQVRIRDLQAAEQVRTRDLQAAEQVSIRNLQVAEQGRVQDRQEAARAAASERVSRVNEELGREPGQRRGILDEEHADRRLLESERQGAETSMKLEESERKRVESEMAREREKAEAAMAAERERIAREMAREEEQRIAQEEIREARAVFEELQMEAQRKEQMKEEAQKSAALKLFLLDLGFAALGFGAGIYLDSRCGQAATNAANLASAAKSSVDAANNAADAAKFLAEAAKFSERARNWNRARCAVMPAVGLAERLAVAEVKKRASSEQWPFRR